MTAKECGRMSIGWNLCAWSRPGSKRFLKRKRSRAMRRAWRQYGVDWDIGRKRNGWD